MAQSQATDQTTRNAARTAGWAGLCVLFLVPVIATPLSSEVRWDGRDFIVFAAMLLALGTAVELVLARIGSGWRRGLMLLVIALGFVAVWVQLAVGIV